MNVPRSESPSLVPPAGPNDVVRFDAAYVLEVDTSLGGNKTIHRGTIVGWVVCPEPLAKLDAFLLSEKLGAARIGGFRPDVADAFPGVPHAAQAGFDLQLTRGRLTGSEPVIRLVATTVGGRSFFVERSLDVFDGRSSPSVEPIRLHVDRCDIDDSNRVCVAGWAVAIAPIVTIQAFVDSHRVASFVPDRLRPDIAAAFPYYPNADGAGFFETFTIPSELRDRVESLYIEVIARDSTTRRASIPPRSTGDVQNAAPPPPRAAHVVQALRTVAVADSPAPRPPDADFRFHCDEVILETTGRLRASGWAIAAKDVTSIRVSVDGALVGTSRLGRPRPDVAKSFPTFVNAARSGYELEALLVGPFEGQHEIPVIVELADGSRREVVLTSIASEPVDTGPTFDGEAIRMAVDGMQIEAGHARRLLTGSFHLSGWAIARETVASVDVFLDDEPLGRAYHGMRREDVSLAFPSYPKALTSGFALSVPARWLRNGRSRIRVQTTDVTGATAEVSFTVDVEKLDSSKGLQALRRKMKHAEVLTSLAILRARGTLPRFDFAMRSGEEESPVDAALSTVSSFASQAYPEWRIWWVGDAGPDRFAEIHARIAAEYPDVADRFASIADYTDSSTPRLLGRIVAGDTVAIDGLLRLALEATDHDGGALVYGDDRRIEAVGSEVGAFFKPDWSPDLLLSQNYLGRSWVVSSALAEKSGIDLPELASMGDYRAALAMTTAAASVRHVRELVFDLGARRESASDELAALEDHLRGVGSDARVARTDTDFLYRVRRTHETRKVSIIIPSIGAKDYVVRCLASIRRLTSDVDYEIVIVDNLRSESLTEETRRWKPWFREHADVLVEADEPFNWSRLNNRGAEASTGDYLLFLNDDIEVLEAGWLGTLLSEASRPEVGVVGARLLYEDGKVQHAGMFMSRAEPGNFRHAFRFAESTDPGYFGLALSQRNVLCVTGACLMVRRETFDSLGGFDESHSVVNNDVDFCLRVHRSGRMNVITPHVRLTHHELASRADLKDEYDRTHFLASWNDLCSEGDPFHHPRISSEVDDYSLEEETVREVYAGYPLGDRDAVRRILVVKLDHIGDLVTSLPAFRRLRAHFPKAHLTALVARACVGIARMEPSIDEVIPFEFFDARSGLGRKVLTDEDYVQLEADLVARRFDLAVDLRKLGDTRHVLQHSGAPLLAGFDHGLRHGWLDIALEWECDTLQVDKRNHIALDLVNLADAVGNAFLGERATIGEDAPLPALSSALVERHPELERGDYVVVHPAAGTPLRQWSPASFARLIDLLVERDGVQVVVLGGPDERPIAEEILAMVRATDRVLDLVGRSTLAEVPRLLAGAALFVGNNSGPSHIAAGVGTPTVSVHSALVSSEEWGPLGPNAVALRRNMTCGPCYIVDVEQCPRQLECLHSLSPFMVYEVCHRFLSLRRAQLPLSRG